MAGVTGNVGIRYRYRPTLETLPEIFKPYQAVIKAGNG